MDSSMPVSLIISWILFIGFISIHRRHAMHFEGAWKGFQKVLFTSVMLGKLVGLGLLVYYYIQVEWYWPLILFFFGSLVGGFLFAFLEVKIGTLVLSLFSFVGWPSSAVWAFLIIRDLHP